MPHLVNLVRRRNKQLSHGIYFLTIFMCTRTLRTKVSGITFASLSDANAVHVTDPLMSECLVYQLKAGRTMVVRCILQHQSLYDLSRVY